MKHVFYNKLKFIMFLSKTNQLTEMQYIKYLKFIINNKNICVEVPLESVYKSIKSNKFLNRGLSNKALKIIKKE